MRSWESLQSVQQQTKYRCQPLPRIESDLELCPPGEERFIVAECYCEQSESECFFIVINF